MCGRYTLTNSKVVKDLSGVLVTSSFNIAPSQAVLVYNGSWKKSIWSYSPSWSRTPMRIINARAETLQKKPSFRDAKRCLFLADGWFEWKLNNKKKIPYYHNLKGNVFYMGGIYNETGCAIVTTVADKKINYIHIRQPLIIDYQHIERWLDGANYEDLGSSNEITCFPVSTYVNSPFNNDRKCIEIFAS